MIDMPKLVLCLMCNLFSNCIWVLIELILISITCLATMDRSWMYGDRREMEYIDGVKEFCNAALEHKRVTDEQSIFCPCRDCGNLKRWVDIKKIEEHLFRHGFTHSYETWLWHGERIVR